MKKRIQTRIKCKSHRFLVKKRKLLRQIIKAVCYPENNISKK
jgi:hypothetical protein